MSGSFKSWFTAGARPAALWVGVLTLLWAGVGHQILIWLVFLTYPERIATAPAGMDGVILGTIITGFVYIATLRSFDKTKGVVTDKLGVQPIPPNTSE